MKHKLLVVDDNVDMKVLFESAFQEQYDLFFCENGEEVLQAIEKETYDLILLDLMLPDISGFELASILKENANTAKADIVVVSAKNDISSKVTAYSLGATNYIEKPFDPRLLRVIIKSLLSRKTEDAPKEIEIEGLKVNILNQSVKFHEENIRLTSSEFKILCYLLERPEQVISRERLLNITAQNNMEVNDRIIDTHISSLRKKMKDTTVQIKAIYREGYTLQFVH